MNRVSVRVLLVSVTAVSAMVGALFLAGTGIAAPAADAQSNGIPTSGASSAPRPGSVGLDSVRTAETARLQAIRAAARGAAKPGLLLVFPTRRGARSRSEGSDFGHDGPNSRGRPGAGQC